MGEKKQRELWTFEELKAYLKIPRSNIYQLIAEEKIPFIQIGRHKRFIPEDIERAIRRLGEL